MGDIPCSKEILPVSDGVVVSHCLLNAFRVAEIDSAFFVIAPGKWDIPEFFGNGSDVGLSLGYLVRRHPYGVPFTVDAAYPFVDDKLVAFGFPDILFEPEDAFMHLISKQLGSQADLVLGVFPVEHAAKWDAVAFDSRGEISRVFPKPHDESTGFTWILAVWTPVFSRLIHNHVVQTASRLSETDPAETGRFDVPLGVLVRHAMEQGLTVESVVFDQGRCLDIGTPEDLSRLRNLGW